MIYPKFGAMQIRHIFIKDIDAETAPSNECFLDNLVSNISTKASYSMPNFYFLVPKFNAHFSWAIDEKEA